MNEEDPQDYRTIVNLLTDQIEFANVIVLNKTDLLPHHRIGEIKAILRKLNGEAKIIESTFGQVSPREILHTGMFDFDKASASAGWKKELENEHTSETEEYGISSFVFRNRKPFHPERFWEYVNTGWHATIIRSKGLFWIVSRPEQALSWSQAGGSLRADSAGVWWVSKPREEWKFYGVDEAFIESRMDEQWGDRMNEIVLIGQDMDKEKIRQELEKCLCTAQEINMYKIGIGFKDPWPIYD